MALKYKYFLWFLLAKVVLSVAYLVDNDVSHEEDYIILEKTDRPGVFSKYYVKYTDDLDDVDQNPYFESEEFPDDLYDYEKNEETEMEEEETPYLKIIPPKALPLRRVRRRIIPRVTGKKAMDTDRGNRNPWDRDDRNPWQSGVAGTGDMRRTGPIGSAKLYALYPHLAPPGWKKKKGGQRKRQQKARKQKEVKEEEELEDEGGDVEVMDQGYSAPKDPIEKVSVTKRKDKPKIKMTKEIKEGIAEYALLHGQDEALVYYQNKLGVRIRPAAVRKFVRRLQDRMERRKLREQLRQH